MMSKKTRREGTTKQREGKEKQLIIDNEELIIKKH
jgi:hypothetical protein